MSIKRYGIVLVLGVLVLAGCGSGDKNPSESVDSSVHQAPENADQSNYAYNRTMTNPSTSATENLMMMQEGYSTGYTLSYTLTKDDKQLIAEAKDNYCEAIDFYDKESSKVFTSLSLEHLQGVSSVDLPVKYEGLGLGIEFSDAQLHSLDEQGFVLIEPNARLLETIKVVINYDPSSIEPGTPERAYYYQTLAGPTSTTERYPYNAIYVSSDLLLHSYHKLFENSLKHYEMTKARDLMVNVIDESLNRFEVLRNTSPSSLKDHYEYLVAYWTLAKALLPSESELKAEVESYSNLPNAQDYLNAWYSELNPETLETYLKTRLHELLLTHPNRYASALEQSLDVILEGKEKDLPDFLAEAFSPQTDPDFFIKQDYTQFVPRGYYTDNTYLETYFRVMKWLMRHKLYTRDDRMAQAALLLSMELPTTAGDNLQELQDFIHKMIGSDDDITLQDLKDFAHSKSLTSDNIATKYKSEWSYELAELRPQRIISTSYQTPEVGSTNEAQAKMMTAGFVFFGEKFTTDSRIMDELTAGSAEQESEIKAPLVSVYQIRDTLMGGTRGSYVSVRFDKINSNYSNPERVQSLRVDAEPVPFTQTRIDAYPDIRDETRSTIAKTPQDDTIYNRWIQLLHLARLTPDNSPSYMSGTSFLKKIYNTILGSYAELKHDTILYVKQAYAELGGGGPGCSIGVDIKPLPVPKGYVEPQIDLIDGLITTAQETQTQFDGINGDNFDLYVEYLEFLRDIALKQSTNQVIDDEDFEHLRISRDILSQIMSPAPGYLSAGERGMRSAIIADIFTSGPFGPYYVATGRPLLMIALIDDENGTRATIGPVFSSYEFYGEPVPMTAGRYTDDDRRSAYDTFSNKSEYMTLPLQELLVQ